MFIEIGVNTIILICFHEMLTKALVSSGFQTVWNYGVLNYLRINAHILTITSVYAYSWV